jgi:hypothetical protein
MLRTEQVMAHDKNGPMVTTGGSALRPSERRDVDAFVEQARALAPGAAGKDGRLVFALDATMSRQPTWDLACRLQGEMFATAATLASGLDVQLVFFRGFSECRASRWVGDPRALTDLMVQISCRGGHTQIGKVLDHVRHEAQAGPVRTLVYVGDAMEERLDDLCATAGQLGLLGVKAFMFQEGQDSVAEGAFREVARLTKGAYARFDAGAAARLAGLLNAAAAYAAGGIGGLERLEGAGQREARLLLGQMR